MHVTTVDKFAKRVGLPREARRVATDNAAEGGGEGERERGREGERERGKIGRAHV